MPPVIKHYYKDAIGENFVCFQLEGSVVTLYTTGNGGSCAMINGSGECYASGPSLPNYWTQYFRNEIETKLSVKIDDEYENIDMTNGELIPADLWEQFETF